MLYIRGTSEQNVIALNYVRDNFGGRPFSTVHESKMQFSDGCSIVVPVDALPFIVTSRLDGDIFPINFNLVLGGKLNLEVLLVIFIVYNLIIQQP